MAGEKFTVTLVANMKKFLQGMGRATKAMKLMGDMNRGIIKNLQTMSSAAAKGGARFNQTVQRMKTGVDKLGKSGQKANKSYKNLFKTFVAGAGIIGSVGAAIFALNKAFKAATDAAAVQVQAKAFANLAASYGKNSTELLQSLREASKGTVDVLQLMTTSSRALLLGIPIDNLVQLMEVARGASKAMGTTVTGAFSDIALGIGRQSRLILDNLGIIVRVGSAYDAYAEKMGTTAEALTDFEKKQAFANAAVKTGLENLERSKTGMIDFEDRVAKFRVAFTELGLKIKGIFLAAFIAIDEFFQDKGISTKLKELFEVTVPDLLISRLKLLIELLERLDKKLHIAERIDRLIKDLDTKGEIFVAKKLAKKGAELSIQAVGMAAGGVLRALLPNKLFEGNVSERPLEEPPGIPAYLKPGFVEEPPGIPEHLKPSSAKSRTSRFDDIIADIQKAMSGKQGATKSPTQIIQENFKKIGTAFSDRANLSAQDLEQEFSVRLKSIKENIKILGKPSKEITNELKKWEDILLKDVKPESFLAGLGILSEREFTKKATQEIAKFERITKNLDTLKIVNPEALQQAYKKVLDNVLQNIDRLTPELRKRFIELNTFMAKHAVPSDSIKKGLNQWVDDYKSAGNRMTQIGVDIANNISSAFETFFIDAVKGQLKGFKETLSGFGDSVLKSVSKALSKKATEELLGLLFGTKGSKTQTQALDKNTSALDRLTLAITGTKFSSIGRGGLFSKLLGRGAGTAGTSGTSGTSGGGGLAGRLGFTGFGKGKAGQFLQSFGKSKGGLIGSLIGGFGKILPFAEGGITNLANAASSAMITKKPTLAAISEKGQREAVVPLDKFADMIQQPNITINAIDTKSFAQYVNENKEILLGAITNVKGSRQAANISPFLSGPF